MNKIMAVTIAFLLFIPFASINGNNVALTNNTNGILYVGGSGPNNYTSIQEAINDAENGYTIYVYSGVYPEHVRIYKPINLIGEDENTTIIDGMNETNVTVFSITANHVNFSHFTIRNISGGELTVGIKIENGDHINVSNCVIKDCDGIGIFSTDNICIQDCNISHNCWGISINGESNNLSIKNCIISYNAGKELHNGWYLGGDGIGISYASNIIIFNCIISHNSFGVYGRDCLNIYISGCTLNYNYHNTPEETSYGRGISFVRGENICVSDCQINHNVEGMYVAASTNIKIENCSICCSIKGIRISKAEDMSILYCDVFHNEKGFTAWQSKFAIHYNNIIDNGIGIESRRSVCNARYNYWGSKFGPSHLFSFRGDRIITIFGKVFYFPWLIDKHE